MIRNVTYTSYYAPRHYYLTHSQRRRPIPFATVVFPPDPHTPASSSAYTTTANTATTGAAATATTTRADAAAEHGRTPERA
jgi:hypothetical protein